MSTKLFVGSLPWSVNDEELKEKFEKHGTVVSAKVITDRDTRRSRGFGFVEMGNDEEAKAAMAALNGKDNQGRAMVVNEARPRAERPSGGGGGGFGGGRGGGRDRY